MVYCSESGILSADFRRSRYRVPSGPGTVKAERKDIIMIDYMSDLWSLMTIFFTDTVFDFPLFQGMILFLTIFYLVYLFKYILDNLARF